MHSEPGLIMASRGGAAPLMRQRITLLLVGLLFAAPMAVAWLLYSGVLPWRPAHTVNHGALVVPARPLTHVSMARPDGAALPAQFLRGRWTFVYIGSADCASVCRRDLYNMRQVRLAQGKNIGRVQNLMLLTGTAGLAGLRPMLTAFPALTVAVPAGVSVAQFVAQFQLHAGDDVAAAGRVYLVDPQGNLMMSYGAGADPRGMLQDLERLLKVSYVG